MRQRLDAGLRRDACTEVFNRPRAFVSCLLTDRGSYARCVGWC
jgi:hypothetical protein